MKKYLKHRVSNFIDINEIFALEYININGKYYRDLDAHDFWETVYVEEGELHLIIDGKELCLTSNEILYIPPNAKHKYTSLSSNSKAFCICFTCFSPFLKLLSKQIMNTTEGQRNLLSLLITEGTNNLTMNQKAQLVFKEHQELGCMQILLLSLEQITIFSLRTVIGSFNNLPAIQSGKDFYASLVEMTKQYLFEHVSERISLNDVCKHVGYSKSFVCNLFKNQTGESLFSYFNKLKIEESKKMLAATDKNSTAISYELGFADVKYYITLFKKVTGQTPLQYQKSVSKDSEL